MPSSPFASVACLWRPRRVGGKVHATELLVQGKQGGVAHSGATISSFKILQRLTYKSTVRARDGGLGALSGRGFG